MRTHIGRRLLSGALALVMLLGLPPVGALAEGNAAASDGEDGAFARTLEVSAATPIVIKGDDLVAEAVNRNRAEVDRLGGSDGSTEARWLSDLLTTGTVAVGGLASNAVNVGGELNFTGVARVEAVLDGVAADESYALRLSGTDRVGRGTAGSGSVTVAFDFLGDDADGKTSLTEQWELANRHGLWIVSGEGGSAYAFSSALLGPTVKEIRLYPVEIELGVYDIPETMSAQEYAELRERLSSVTDHPTAASVRSSYRVYDGLTRIQETRTYDAGTVTVPQSVFLNEPLYYTFAPGEEGAAHYAAANGFYRYALETVPEGAALKKDNKRSRGQVLYDSADFPRGGLSCSFEPDGASLLPKRLPDGTYELSRFVYLLCPVVEGREINSVTIAKYDADMGELRIGGKLCNDATLERSRDGFAWREGDELIVSVAPGDGFSCDGVRVTRRGGDVETVAAGERLILSDGMTIEPLFRQDNISLTLYWAKLGAGASETKNVNLNGYQIGYTYSGTNAITFQNNGDGSYTFGNLTSGKVLTLFAGPQDGYVKDRTGVWLREAVGGETGDDTSYLLHVGDARAITVDNRDMRMAYYLGGVDSGGGTVLSGQVCARGGSLKHASAGLAASNAEKTATFLSGVTVSAVSMAANASRTVDGKTYTTSAVTDENGGFAIYVPGGAYGCGVTLSLMRDDLHRIVSVPLLEQDKLLIEVPAQNGHFRFDAIALGQDADADELPLTDEPVTLNLRLLADEGYSAQRVVFTSCDADGGVFKEWNAEKSGGDWNYTTTIIPSKTLKAGGRLTVEAVDGSGRRMGKVNTGYVIKAAPEETTPVPSQSVSARSATTDGSVAMDAAFYPAYPLSGERAAAVASARSLAAIPTDKLTLRAELVNASSGETEDLGTRDSNSRSVTERVAFAMPEDAEGWTLRLTAWEDELSGQPSVMELPLPCGARPDFAHVRVDELGVGRYAVAFDVVNAGNRALSGATIRLQKEPENVLAACALPGVAAKEERHEYVSFALPDELCNESGENVVWLLAESAEGEVLAKRALTIRREKPNARPEKLAVNGSDAEKQISLRVGETSTLNAVPLPAGSGSGCAVVYRSEDAKVASVDANGRITAVSAGATVVRAEAALAGDTLLIDAENVLSSRSGSLTKDKHGMVQYASGGGKALAVDITVLVSAASAAAGGGGGGSSLAVTDLPYVSSYPNGVVILSKINAAVGETVTLAPQPDKGYRVVGIVVKDSRGNALPVTKYANGTYTFIMPDNSGVTVIPTFEWAGASLFGDVPAKSYYAEAVAWAVANGVTNGTSDAEFSPGVPCTRAQTVTFLYRAAGSPAIEPANAFSDVPPDSYYAKAVAWAVANGVTTGTGEGRFSPKAPCTRAQAVTFLHRAARLPSASASSAFRDVSADMYYARAVAWAVADGITNGTDEGVFSPNDFCTRAHIVTFLFRYFAK